MLTVKNRAWVSTRALFLFAPLRQRSCATLCYITFTNMYYNKRLEF